MSARITQDHPILIKESPPQKNTFLSPSLLFWAAPQVMIMEHHLNRKTREAFGFSGSKDADRTGFF